MDENKRQTKSYDIIICCCAWCRTAAGNDGRPTANHAAHIINTDRLSRYQQHSGGGGGSAVAGARTRTSASVSVLLILGGGGPAGRLQRYPLSSRRLRPTAYVPSLPPPPSLLLLHHHRTTPLQKRRRRRRPLSGFASRPSVR